MRSLVVCVAMLALLIGAGWYGLHYIPVDFGYLVTTEFEAVPPSDEPLQTWLRGQPGVFRAWVEREPVETLVKVSVGLGMTRNQWGDPPFPNLANKCAEFGYKGQQGPFRDVPFGP